MNRFVAVILFGCVAIAFANPAGKRPEGPCQVEQRIAEMLHEYGVNEAHIPKALQVLGDFAKERGYNPEDLKGLNKEEVDNAIQLFLAEFAEAHPEIVAEFVPPPDCDVAELIRHALRAHGVKEEDLDAALEILGQFAQEQGYDPAALDGLTPEEKEGAIAAFLQHFHEEHPEIVAEFLPEQGACPLFQIISDAFIEHGIDEADFEAKFEELRQFAESKGINESDYEHATPEEIEPVLRSLLADFFAQ